MRIAISKSDLDKYLSSTGISVLLFFYIYTPKLIYLPVNFGYLSLLIAFVYFSFKFNISKLIALLNSKVFITFLYFYIFCIIYAVLVAVLSKESYSSFFLAAYTRLLTDIVLAIPFFVVFFKDELNYDIDRFLKKLLNLGIIQGVIATIMVVIPSVRDLAYQYIFSLPTDKLLAQSYRGFGVSSDFYLSTPLFQALIFALNTKFYLEGRGKKYLIYYPFILISMLLNARTSVIIIPIMFIVIIVMSFYYDEFKWLRKLSSLLIAGLVLVVGLAIYFYFNPDKLAIILWAAEGIMGAVGALTGTGESVTLNIIIKKQLHLPHQMSEIIFGKGLVVFGNPKSSVTSDLGYIRYIYYGGVVLSLMFYFNIYNFAKSCIALTSDKFFKIFLISITAMIFVAHFKGDVFNSSAFMKGVFLIQVFMLYKGSERVVQ